MAGRDYCAAIQELKETHDRLASSISDLNSFKDWVLGSKRTLDNLQRRLVLEEQARRAAEERENALLEEVARLRALLQQERDCHIPYDRSCARTRSGRLVRN
ncbi:hypothetical protein F442_10177 [Phytophthora nicotianae P10297]|uniref:Uncharacterized protein n=5 Tax=Phytophthora nicotianae TaxID=4792 RepID=W2RAJ9_PHYN3|nr:hypothetical protein PPTG_21099 [Phytophthora nicotianae INRA-310]ETI45063.1 hypothetical protein F443_10273 [Phytophthora nicotianae P1569]ETK85039.1 hypothetical protein L915_10049 [Phytophthora nicotianae]ETO73699.1 hypothetical protein F444_10374 [Phytophthora nicotianae P1976]ETP42948.1 hypothetical protein F442_10177 [Phytophthora nicotianae P10297]ETL38460.1 hypothetical protein L916_09958 [Phytophthora nicotianae]